MKKTLLVLSAVLALSMAFVGCKKSTGGNEPDGSDPKTVANPVFVLTYNADAQYAAPEIAVADDWASIEIVFADDTPFDKIQFAFTSDAVKAQQSWGTEYWAYYPKATATSKFVIADTLTAESEDGTLVSNGATKIVKVAIQNVTKEAITVKIMSAKVTKTDGTEVEFKLTGDWGSSVN